MLIISFPTAGFMVLANRIKFYQLVYFIGTLLLVHLSYNAEIKMATKECVKEHNNISKYIEFDANCYKEDESKSDADSSDPEEHMCFVMRRYCARRCAMSVYGRKCKVESLFTLNLEEEDDGTPVTLDCVCSYHKYKRGCLSTYQMTWEEVLDEFEANCSKSTSKAGGTKILVIGGKNKAERATEIYCPNEPKNNLLGSATLLKKRTSHTSQLMNDGTVVIVGGSTGTAPYTSAECEILNPVENKVSKCDNMKQARAYAASVVLQGLMYLCGGVESGMIFFSSCERYPFDGSKSITPISTSRAGHAMVELDGFIYAVGGSGPTGNLRTAERYNPSDDKWIEIATMEKDRDGPAAAVLNGRLHVCGGAPDAVPIASCKVYDNMADIWTMMKIEMKKPRKLFSLIAARDRLYALGGEDTDRSVEMYDPKSQKWTILKQKLIHERIDSSAVLLQ